MSYQSIPLLAGKPHLLDIPGKLLLIDSPGVAGGVDVQLMRNGQPGQHMPNRKAAFRHVGDFDGVILTSSVDSTVGLFLSFDDVQLGVTDGASVTVPGGVVITNPGNAPVPVTFSQQIVPLGSVAVNNNNASAVPVQTQQLGTIVDHSPAVINAGAAQLLINDATYKRLRVRNNSAAAVVAIGGSAVTMANAAIILQPGDTWVEDDAAGAAWYAVSDIAAADVRVMGVK